MVHDRRHVKDAEVIFVVEGTAHPSVDVLEKHSNSGVLYYHTLRQLIATHLEDEAEEVFLSEIERDETYFGGAR